MTNAEITIGRTVWVVLDQDDMYGAQAGTDNVIEAGVTAKDAHSISVVDIHSDDYFDVDPGRCFATEAEARATQVPREMTGVDLIAAERKRQVTQEGRTPEHDDIYRHEQLAAAGAIYALPAIVRNPDLMSWWPFDQAWWKPTPRNRIRELVKAGALIAAEIDRLQRAESARRRDALRHSYESRPGGRVCVSCGGRPDDPIHQPAPSPPLCKCGHLESSHAGPLTKCTAADCRCRCYDSCAVG